ncbi:MAG: hypothetical protein HW394_699, partial [Acidobacteria bacterium]|nr:hypothetical protein [Acidobacteriota bacterium]
MIRVLAVVLLAAALLGTRADAALAVDVLRSVGGLPPHIVGLFEEPLGFQQTPGGPYYVFDRRGHTVYTVGADKQSARKLIEIGQELGRIIQPRGFDTSANGGFVVADAPTNVERVQMFGASGIRLGGFTLPARQRTAALTFGPLIINGIASIQYAGTNLLISQPESGALLTEYSSSGFALRGIGRLRDTGQEQDRDLHLALNVGLPVVDPTGGFFYVFVGGRPMFHKYDSNGRLLFERHVEGIELDDYLASLPTHWPTRRIADRELPLVLPAVRAAAVDPEGQLWISLSQPYTYVYDAHGDKVRTVQFSASGTVSPTSLFFTRDGRLLVTPGCYEFNPTAR